MLFILSTGYQIYLCDKALQPKQLYYQSINVHPLVNVISKSQSSSRSNKMHNFQQCEYMKLYICLSLQTLLQE